MEKRPCPVCGNLMNYFPNRQEKYNQKTCSLSCAAKMRKRKPCSVETKEKISQARIKFLRETAKGRETRKMLSERMKINNPGSSLKTQEKIRNTKRINGTLHIWKGIRGGNGKLTEPQLLLANALGWQVEVAIPTLTKRGLGYPTCYKVDIGNNILKFAIEVDGSSHKLKSIMLKDLKKTLKLQELGWKVLRFTNQEIMTNLSEVLLIIKKEIKGM
jgi:hypothetical protein